MTVSVDDVEDKRHCVHRTNIVYPMNPPAYPEYCCQCGETETRYSHYETEPGHGPFLQSGGADKIVQDNPWKNNCQVK